MRIFLPAIPLLAGFLLDLILGDPHALPHPVRLIGKLISTLEKGFRKAFSSHLVFGGAALSAAVLALSFGVSFAVIFVCYKINFWIGICAESILCYYLIAAKSLKNESMKVYKSFQKNDLEGARNAVSMIVGRDTEPLDRDGIIRAAVETVAENTSDGVTAPMIFIAFFGAPGGFFYKAANTLDSMIGYKNERYLQLGKFAAKLDDVLNFLPSRITALVMIISSFLLRFDGKNAFKIWRRDRKKHASPNSAQTESVCAGALRVRLAGDAFYFGELHKKEFIGDDLRSIENEDIRRANGLMYLTSTIILVLCCTIRIWLYGGIFK